VVQALQICEEEDGLLVINRGWTISYANGKVLKLGSVS
jgi:hypothetical protein